jgi:hypothetical protein
MDHKTVFDNSGIEISEASKKSYNERISRIMKVYKDNLIHHEEYNIDLPSFQTIYNDDNISLSSKYSYMNALLAYMKHKHMKRDLEGVELYKDIYNKKMIDTNQATERQLKIDDTYESLLSKVDDLIKKENWFDALLLGMYTLIEPLRSNYGSVKLTTTEEEHLKNIEEKQNHIYKNKIYMFDLKTNKDKIYEQELPDKLINIINNTLILHKRNYLFLNNKLENMDNRQFSLYANNRLRKIINNPNFQLTDFRHLKINSIDPNLSTREKKAIAKNMNHSLEMQDQYRQLNKEEKFENKTNKEIDILVQKKINELLNDEQNEEMIKVYLKKIEEIENKIKLDESNNVNDNINDKKKNKKKKRKYYK